MPCRCLLADSFPDMALNIAAYIASLPDEIRTDEETRQKRLQLCLSCAHLRDGTCTLCGCYVEARSAKQSLHCPDAPPQW